MALDKEQGSYDSGILDYEAAMKIIAQYESDQDKWPKQDADFTIKQPIPNKDLSEKPNLGSGEGSANSLSWAGGSIAASVVGSPSDDSMAVKWLKNNPQFVNAKVVNPKETIPAKAGEDGSSLPPVNIETLSPHSDPVRVSVVIMSHPSRLKVLKKTIESLGPLAKNVKVVIDKHSDGIWENTKRAWRSYDTSADWHMVLQDDIVVHPDFLGFAPTLIDMSRKAQGDLPISFCSKIPNAAEVALNQNKKWIMTDWVNHAQAIAMPTWMVEGWITWSDMKIRKDWRHSDLRLELYLMAHKRLMMTMVPNLVEHGDQGSVDGFLKKHPGSIHLDHKTPAMSLDWSLGIDDPVRWNRKVWDQYRQTAFAGL